MRRGMFCLPNPRLKRQAISDDQPHFEESATEAEDYPQKTVGAGASTVPLHRFWGVCWLGGRRH
jgi:hypothetical protein